jgi:hypothetical protein
MKNMAVWFLLGLAASLTQAQTSVAPHAATLVQQKMCDEQAWKKYHEDNPKAGPLSSYTSHYDVSANVCYIMVHSYESSGGTPAISTLVYDAFEGRMYASYMWMNTEKKKGWVEPLECYVKPRGQEQINCKSSDEFDRLVDKYFGISG